MAPAGKELWAQRGPDLRLRQVGEVVGYHPYPWRGTIFIQIYLNTGLYLIPYYVYETGLEISTILYSPQWYKFLFPNMDGGSFKSFELSTKYISGLGVAKMNPNSWHLGFFEGQYQCGLNQCEGLPTWNLEGS